LHKLLAVTSTLRGEGEREREGGREGERERWAQRRLAGCLMSTEKS